MTIIGREEISKFTKICAILKENRADHAGPGTYLFHYMIIRILNAEKIKTQDMSLSSMMTLGPPMLSEVKPKYFYKYKILPYHFFFVKERNIFHIPPGLHIPVAKVFLLGKQKKRDFHEC